MNKEILLVVESISNEKNVDKEIIFRAIEEALVVVTKRRYSDADIVVVIDRESGDYETFRCWQVVATPEEQEFPAKQLTLEQARHLDPQIEVGGVVKIAIESVKYGRISAQLAKQIIVREIRKAEYERLLEHFRKYLNSIVAGSVKRVTRDYVILDMGDGVEGIIRSEDMLPKESWRLQDRVRGVLVDIKSDNVREPLLIISRTVPTMLKELFKIEVPEIAEDVIVIKSIARDPGFRSKIAVKSNDGRIDPIGACIGIRGTRVQAVSNELNGEKIDVVVWDDNPAQLVVNAMVPAEIASMIVDEGAKKMVLAVKDDQLAQAIGRNGQNIKLACELTGWKLDVISVEEAADRLNSEQNRIVQSFVDKLDVDEELATLLAREGFRTIEDIAHAPGRDLTMIDGIDEEVALALKERAGNALLEQALSDEQVGATEPSTEMLALAELPRHVAYLLASKGVVTLEDLAEQSVDDLLELVGSELDRDQAARLIMAARESWF